MRAMRARGLVVLLASRFLSRLCRVTESGSCVRRARCGNTCSKKCCRSAPAHSAHSFPSRADFWFLWQKEEARYGGQVLAAALPAAAALPEADVPEEASPELRNSANPYINRMSFMAE